MSVEPGHNSRLQGPSLDLIPLKSHSPRSTFLAQRDLSFPPLMHHVSRRERAQAWPRRGRERAGHSGPGPGAPKKKTFQELSLLPTGFYRCPLLTSPPPKKMTLNLPSNKNKYVCLFPEPLTALSWPRDLGRIDGPASLGGPVHLLLKVVSQ